jgi:hypothetical protein
MFGERTQLESPYIAPVNTQSAALIAGQQDIIIIAATRRVPGVDRWASG